MRETIDTLMLLFSSFGCVGQSTILVTVGAYCSLAVVGAVLAAFRHYWILLATQLGLPCLYPFWLWANHQAFLWSKGHGVPLLWQPVMHVAYIMLWATPLLSLWLFVRTVRTRRKNSKEELANQRLHFTGANRARK